jgi:RimJ/RimL family protein N-acetyltransferase
VIDSIRLRAWRDEDASALAAAWGDPEVRRWTAVPEDPSEEHAAHWIAGCEDRRRRGVSLDLVVSPLDSDEVLGEVGFVRERDIAVMGWWVAPRHRGQGIATAAVRLLAERARAAGLEPVARVDPANTASLRIARNAGVAC